MKLQFALDKSAIGLSLLCVAHCLVLPTVAVLLPAMLATPLGGEIFHKLLLVGVGLSVTIFLAKSVKKPSPSLAQG